MMIEGFEDGSAFDIVGVEIAAQSPGRLIN